MLSSRVAVLMLALLLTACATPGAGSTPQPTMVVTSAVSGTQGSKLRVVASFSILGDLVQQVGGDHVEIKTLVGPDQDAHTFEPSPSDSASVAGAAVVFATGLGFEPWLDRLYAVSQTRAERVVVTTGLSHLIGHDEAEAQAVAATSTQPPAADAEHGPAGEFDPHVWHDVQNTEHMVGVIRDALVRTDPGNAEAYRRNADTYLEELRRLDDWIVAEVGALPPERRKLVTTHNTFAYFARRYGFVVLGAALGSATTETAEPSAGEFARLVQEIKATGVPAIFPENVSDPRLIERLAKEAGVKLAPPLYTDALDKPGTPGDTYAGLMRHNVSTIVAALR